MTNALLSPRDWAPPPLDGHGAVERAAAAGRAPPSFAELAAYFTREAGRRRTTDAHRTWLQTAALSMRGIRAHTTTTSREDAQIAALVCDGDAPHEAAVWLALAIGAADREFARGPSDAVDLAWCATESLWQLGAPNGLKRFGVTTNHVRTPLIVGDRCYPNGTPMAPMAPNDALERLLAVAVGGMLWLTTVRAADRSLPSDIWDLRNRLTWTHVWALMAGGLALGQGDGTSDRLGPKSLALLCTALTDRWFTEEMTDCDRMAHVRWPGSAAMALAPLEQALLTHAAARDAHEEDTGARPVRRM